MQTHMAVIYFGGDPGDDHPDAELRGRGPSLELIAAGSEERCLLRPEIVPRAEHGRWPWEVEMPEDRPY